MITGTAGDPEWIRGLARASAACSARPSGRSSSGRGSVCAAHRSASSCAAGCSSSGSAEDALLLRVFCHAYGDRITLLLGGYDKGEDPSEKRQERAIAEARRRLEAWRRRQRP